jgi:hypothetical protein
LYHVSASSKIGKEEWIFCIKLWAELFYEGLPGNRSCFQGYISLAAWTELYFQILYKKITYPQEPENVLCWVLWHAATKPNTIYENGDNLLQAQTF